jgi:hypothetical protein
MKIPDDLVVAVNLLSIENPSDYSLAQWIIEKNSELVTDAQISWLAALVKRNGVTFNGQNPLHLADPVKPTTWPLQ